MTLPRTDRVPALDVLQLAVGVPDDAPKPDPAPQSNAYVKLVARGYPGTCAFVSASAMGWPTITEAGAVKVAVGSTVMKAPPADSPQHSMAPSVRSAQV